MLNLEIKGLHGRYIISTIKLVPQDKVSKRCFEGEVDRPSPELFGSPSSTDDTKGDRLFQEPFGLKSVSAGGFKRCCFPSEA